MSVTKLVRLTHPLAKDWLSRNYLTQSKFYILKNTWSFSPRADEFQLGDHLIAIPRHACPTSALFEFADVIDEGVAIDRWRIAARDRQLTV